MYSLLICMCLRLASHKFKHGTLGWGVCISHRGVAGDWRISAEVALGNWLLRLPLACSALSAAAGAGIASLSGADTGRGGVTVRPSPR